MSHFVKAGLVLCLGILSACAGGPAQVQPKPVPAPVASKTVQSSAPALPDTYRIALLLPLSGPSRDIGEAALNGAMMGFYEFHSPQDVELELYDTRGTGEGARQAASQALEDNAQIIVGPVFSRNVTEVADIVGPEGIPVLALSNDKLAARENVKVLGPHLEGEVEKLLQMAVQHRSESVLLFAPENGYGYRLEQEFDRLMDDHRELVFKTVLFPDRANVDELTQLISETGSFEARARQLNEILEAFEAHYKKVQDASKALTYAADKAELSQRWVERYPFACEPPKLEGASAGALPITSAVGTVGADGTFLLNALTQPGSDTPPKAQAYAHTRPCETDFEEYAEDLAREYELALEAEFLALEAEMIEREANAMLPFPDETLEPALPSPEEVVEEALEAALEETLEEAREEVGDTAPAIDEPVLLTPDYIFAEDELQALMDSVPDLPTAEELLAERLKTELEDAQFTLLDDMAVCLGFIAEKNYDQDRGVETLVRTLAKREVLGPPEFDTVILPLAGDQLRIISSLFDFYHVGPPNVRFFGDSQWDKIERLYEEPSLRQAKWLSVARPFSDHGRARYEANFQQAPGYISALAFDATRLAFDQSAPERVRKAPPGSDGFIMGESGAFRINEDGTNQRLIGVKTLRGQETTDADKAKPEALIRKASGPEFGEDREMYLKRTCLGLY